MSADLMDFGDALKALKLGFRVARQEWCGDVFTSHLELIKASTGTELIVITQSFNDGIGAYEPTQDDLLATDWGIV